MTKKPPFTYYGVELICPFVVKYGRKEIKRYAAPYTCLSSRGMHIEDVHCLSTESFIISLRRFVGCKGNVRLIKFEMVQTLLEHQ